MSKSSEHIEISECPVCKNSHRYGIVIERDVMMGWMSNSAPEETPRSVSFERLFICPEKNIDFQANIKLTDTSLTRIIGVDIENVPTEKSTNEA